MRSKQKQDSQQQHRRRQQSPNYNNNTYNQSPISLHQQQPNNSRRNRTQSQISSEGNTIDMVKLVNRRENNRISKMNNFREVYKGHYNNDHVNNMNRNRQYQRTWRQQMGNDDGNSNRNYKEGYKEGQQLPYNINSPTYSINNNNNNPISPTLRPMPSIHKSQSHRLQSRQSLPFRPSQIQLLYDMDTSPRNRVIGYLLLILFVIFSLQLIFVMGYFLSENYYVDIVTNGDNVIDRFKVYQQEVYEDSYRSQLFVTTLLIYSLAQLLYHSVVYLVDSREKKNNRNNLNNNPSTTSQLIDPQTSSLTYILHCRDITRQSNTFIQKLIKSPKFTLFIIVLSVILSMYGSVVCFFYSEFNKMWLQVIVAQGEQYSHYGLLQMIVFVKVMPELMGYLFFQRMHVVGNSGDDSVMNGGRGDNYYNYGNNINTNNYDNHQQQQRQQHQQLTHPLTSQFSTLHQHQLYNKNTINNNNNNNKNIISETSNHQNNHLLPPLPLTTFTTNKWHYKLSLTILLLTIIYSLITTKYWLCIVMIANIEILFVRCKYKIDTFYVQFIGKLIVGLIVIGVLVYWRVFDQTIQRQSQLQQQLLQSLSYIPSLTTIIFITIITTLSILTHRLLATHYIRQQLYKHLIQQQSLIISTIMGSIVITYLFYSYVVVNQIQMDYFSYGVMVVLGVGMIVSLVKQGNEREEIMFRDLQRQSQNVIEMDVFNL